MMKIDAVVAWVDGEDPVHKAKRELYLAGQKGRKPTPLATKARRFSNNDEIRYCLRSIRNFAPWIGTIHLVTDSQFPASIDREIAREHGVVQVDHTHIFRGHEALLPTFNSLAIETFLWNIDGLAENFLYFNDDMFLTGPVSPRDFFTEDGRPVLRGRWSNFADPKRMTFHGRNKLNAALLAGHTAERVFSPAHVVYPLKKSVLAELYARHEAAFRKNASYRFRDRAQFWPIALQDNVLLDAQQAVRTRYGNSLHFSVAFCTHARPAALRRRLAQLYSPQITMACINFWEAVAEKVPQAPGILESVTGPPAPFEKPSVVVAPVADTRGPLRKLFDYLVWSIRPGPVAPSGSRPPFAIGP
jgi:hypothetical protein